jgi:serine phosphatase RsbU (regulator of sigma subunit)
MEDPDPSRVLRRLNHFLAAGGARDGYATALVAHYRPAERDLRIANAGHPLPLLISGTGAPRAAVLGEPGPALGVFAHAEFATQHVTLAPDMTLFVYTDGLTDPFCESAPGQHLRLAHATAEACSRAGRAGSIHEPTAALVLHHLLDAMCVAEVPEDDVCVAVLRGVEPTRAQIEP